MDLWGLSRSAFYREAFQTQTPPQKPSRDLIEKLNAVSLTGPMANREYFKGLMKDVLGVQVPVVREGFQGQPSTSGPTMDQMLDWIDTTSTATPPIFQLSSADTTNLSQIDQLEQFYLAADAERTRLLGEIHTFIGGKVTEFQTIVGNVAAVYSTLTATESTVNAYTTEGITGMDEAALATAWNNYTTASGTLTSSVDTALAPKISDYNNLYSKYATFIGTNSVQNVDGLAPSPSTLDAYAPPGDSTASIALADLKGINGSYTNVPAYFGATGFLEQMRSRIASELADWEGEYFEYWNGLTDEVKAQYNYSTMRPTNIASMTPQQLISTMNDFLGVADEPTTTPVVSRVTQLATGTIQQQALAAIRQFYVLAIEGMVTVKQLADLTGNATSVAVPGASVTAVNTLQVPAQDGVTIATLYSGLGTSLSIVRSTLSETNQVEIAKAKLRYEAGYTALFSFLTSEFQKRVAEYNGLAGMIVGMQTENGSIPSDLTFSFTPVDTAADTTTLNTLNTGDLETLRTLQYNYFITNFPALVTAYKDVYTFLSNQNQTLQSKALTLRITEALPTVSVSALPATPLAASATRILPEYGPNYPPDTYTTATVQPVHVFTTLTGTLTTVLQQHLNYRNNVTQQILNKISGSTTSYTAFTTPAELRNSFVTARTAIRDAVWSAVATFQTRVENVKSVYPVPPATLTDTETEVNGYEEVTTNAQDVPILVDTWTTYTTANGTFVPAANAALTAAQSLYDRLYRTYNRFVGLPSVTSIDEISPIDASDEVPAVNSLKANNYQLVNVYFNNSTGNYDSVLTSVRTQLDQWENEYFRMYDALPSNVKEQFAYEDMTGIMTKSAEELILVMNAFGGVGDVADILSPSPTGQITRLVTGTLQQQALESIRLFYKGLLENLVLFTNNNAIPQANFTVVSAIYTIAGQSIASQQQTTNITSLRVAMIPDMTTLNRKLTTPLNSSEQGVIADMKARYDEGLTKLNAYVAEQYTARVGEYEKLLAFKDAFEDQGITLTAPATPFNPANRFNLCIARFPAIASTFKEALDTIRAANNAMQDTAATKPQLPARAVMWPILAPPTCSIDISGCGPTDIVPDLVENAEAFSVFFETYMDETVPRVQALRQRIVNLTTALQAELNYRNELTVAILKHMVTGLEEHVGVSETIKNVANASDTWTSKTTVADILADYDIYNDSLKDYVAEVKPKVEKSLTEYDLLYSQYKAFRQNALRITADGAPAPSRFLRNEPIIDNQIADLSEFAAKPAEDTLDTLAGVALQNKLVVLGAKYGDNKKDGTELLPSLINLTSTEVADYIANYAARFVSLVDSTRTLALPPSTVLADDQAALESITVTAEQVRTKMAAYGDVSTGLTTRLLEAVDRDAVWDAMDEFNDTRMHSFAIASAKTNDDTGAIFGSASANIGTIMLADIETVKVTTDSTVINQLYNKYTMGLATFTAGVNAGINSDIANIKTVFTDLRSKYDTFKTTYDEFMEYAGVSWQPLVSSPFATLATPISEYSDGNTDTVIEDVTALLTFLKIQLNAFKDAADDKVGKENGIQFSNPSPQNIITFMGSDLLQTLAESVVQPVRGKEPDTFVNDVHANLAKLGPYKFIIEKMTDYMVTLKSQHRTKIKSSIDEFVKKYNTQFINALKALGEGKTVPAELSAKHACQGASESPIGCQDTSATTENLAPSAQAVVGTFAVGYPYADYTAVDSATTLELTQYQQKYVSLNTRLDALKQELLGIVMTRQIVIPYATDWFSIYSQNENAFDAYAEFNANNAVYSQFLNDKTRLESYFKNLQRSGTFDETTAAFNQLSETDLKTIFGKYYKGHPADGESPAVPEGEYYRNILKVFANRTIEVIEIFKTKHTNNLDTLLVKPEILTTYPQFTQATLNAETGQDILTLNGSSVSYAQISSFYTKYMDTYAQQLDDAITIGDTTARARNLTKNAIVMFKNEYITFTPKVFFGTNASERSTVISNLVAGFIGDQQTLLIDAINEPTQLLRSKSDPDLETIRNNYYGALPIQRNETSMLVNYGSKFTSLSTLPPKESADTLIKNVKWALAKRIRGFQQTYHGTNNANDALWNMPKATFHTSTYFNINQEGQSADIDARIETYLTDLNNASVYDQIDRIYKDFVDSPGYETMLQAHLATLTALKASREGFEETMQSFIDLILSFTLAEVFAADNTYSSEIGTFRNIVARGQTITYEDVYYEKDKGALDSLNTKYSKGGTAYTTVLAAAADTIKAKINEFLTTYKSAGTSATAPSPSLFTDVYATRNRMGDFAPSYRNLAAVTTKVNTDISGVDAAETANNSVGMLQIWSKYADVAGVEGAISYLKNTVITQLRAGREQRLDVGLVLLQFYMMYQPLSGKLLKVYNHKLLNNLFDTDGTIGDAWLTVGSNGNYTLREEFLKKSTNDLDNISNTYISVMPASADSSATDLPDLQFNAPTDPVMGRPVANPQPIRPSVVEPYAPFIKDIRYQMYMRIRETVNLYNEYSYLFNLEGVSDIVGESLQYSAFTGVVNDDIGALRNVSVDEIVEMQNKYYNSTDTARDSYIAKIQTIVGPLLTTQGLRQTIVTAAVRYVNVYQKFKQHLFTQFVPVGSAIQAIQHMENDRLNESCPIVSSTTTDSTLSLNCYYDAEKSTGQGIYTITNNDTLTCVKVRFTNPQDYTPEADQTDLEKASRVRCPVNLTLRQGNAYYRLLDACRFAMKQRIDECLASYNEKQTDILNMDENGNPQRIPHMDILNIQTTVNTDKELLDTTDWAQLYTRLQTLQNKYYGGESTPVGLLTRIQMEADGGGEIAQLRTKLTTAMNALETAYVTTVPSTIFTSLYAVGSRITPSVVTKYTEILGSPFSTRKTDNNTWFYLDSGVRKRADKFVSMDASGAIVAQTGLYEAALAQYVTDVKAALNIVITKYTEKYNENLPLFTDVVNRRVWQIPLGITMGAITEVNQNENSISEDVNGYIEVYKKYFVGQEFNNQQIQGYITLLNTGIEEAQKVQAVDIARKSIERLYRLYERYKVLVGRPVALTTADTHVTYSVSTGRANDIPDGGLTLLSIAQLTGTGALNSQMDAAYNTLLAAIRQPLRDFITSYKNLRNTFLDFYAENKGTYFTDPTFETMLTNRDNSDTTDDANLAKITNSATDAEMHVVFKEYLEPKSGATENASTILIGLVRGFFTGDQGAISIFKTQYQFISSEMAVEAPQVFTDEIKAADKAVVRGPTTLAGLTSIVAKYDERFDFVRISKSRLAAATAIRNYWEALAQYPEIAVVEKAKPIYAESITYVNFENREAPTYPFTPLFMRKTASELDTVKANYESALRTFTGAMTKQFESDVTEFYEVIWPKFTLAIGKTDIDHIRFVAEMQVLNPSIQNIQATAARMLLNSNSDPYTVGSQQVAPRIMYSRMIQFMADAKLLFTTFQYKSCIVKDASARSMQFSGQSGAFQQLFGNNTGGVFGSNPFEAFQVQPRVQPRQHQPQPQPQHQPQTQQPQGTSRWSLF